MIKYIKSIKVIASIAMAIPLCFLIACEEDLGVGVNKVGEKPLVVSNVQVTPISGGAILKYDLPVSEDLRYVKAIYTLDNGIKRETKSSIYKNQLTVDGFGEAGSYDIELRSVSVGEVESDPLIVKTEVLTPPHQLVLDQMKDEGSLLLAFGGFNVNYVNETKANLVIRVIKKDSLGVWIPLDTEYTNFEKGVIRIRGQEPKSTDFGIFIEDRWDHASDTLIVNFTPIEEVLIPRDNWNKYNPNGDNNTSGLPGDAALRTTATSGGFSFNGIWDDNINVGYLSTKSPNPPGGAPDLPVSCTIDLGVQARFSRMVIWATRPSNSNDIYGGAHVQDFEIYGSNNPNPNGEFDETWTLLDRFVGERPSGLGFNQSATSEEIAHIRANGETYEFSNPELFEKFRYIRFRIHRTWNNSDKANFFIYELYLYGQL